jgi:hypothetical protein
MRIQFTNQINADPWRSKTIALAFLIIFSISVSISYGIYPLSYTLGQEKRCSGQNNPCWQKTNRKVLLNFVPPGSQDSFCFVFRKHFILADHAVLFFMSIVYQLFTCLLYLHYGVL